MSSTVVVLIKVDLTLQTKSLSLKPLLKEQSMLGGNRPPYRMFIDLGVPWQSEKKNNSIWKIRLHTCTQREGEKEIWRSWRYRGKAKDNNKMFFLEALDALARLSVVLVFLFVFCSVIFMDSDVCWQPHSDWQSGLKATVSSLLKVITVWYQPSVQHNNYRSKNCTISKALFLIIKISAHTYHSLTHFPKVK